ncbi:MAG: protein kinase [Armatimonadota bacterium]
MLKPRTVLIALMALLFVWVGWLVVQSGLQAPTFCQRLGASVEGWGLVGLSAKLHATAAGFHRDALAAAEAGQAGPEVVAARREALCAAEKRTGQLYALLGGYQQANEHLGAARKLDPGDAEVPVLMAEIRLKAGKPELAKESMLYLWKAGKNNAAAAALLGDIFAAQDMAEDAAGYYEAALKLDAGNCRAALGLAQLLREEDQGRARELAQAALVAAETVAEKRDALAVAQSVGADVGNARLVLARAWFARHRTQVAVAAVVLLLVVAPLAAGAAGTLARLPLARLYLALGRADPKALNLYRNLLERRPRDLKLLAAVTLHDARTEPGRAEAQDLAERWLEGAPDDPGAIEAYARVAVAQHRSDDQALEACQRWYEAEPEDPEDFHKLASWLADAYVRRGILTEAAIPVLEAAREGRPDDLRLLQHLGAAYQACERHQEAAQALEQVVAVEPDNLAARHLLGQACVGAGEYYAAYRYLRGAEPGDEVDTALYVAAVGAQNAGQERQALRIFQEVARRDPSFADVRQRARLLSAAAEVARVGDYSLQYIVNELEAYRTCAATAEDGREVAVCMIDQDVSDALPFPGIFRRRLEALKAVEHEVLPKVLDGGVDQEQYYVVTELAGGKTVARLLEERERLSLREAAAVMAEVLRGLQHLHQEGLVHGDVRPENVTVGGDGRVKLAGAGLTLMAAEALGEAHASQVGCAETAAPEIIEHAQPSPSRDIYGVGCMLYHALVGQPPFRAGTRLATMMAHAASEATPPSQLERSLYAEVDRVVLKAMSKNPEERYETASDLREALLQLAGIEEAAREVVLGAPAQLREGKTTGQWWDAFEDVDLLEVGRFAKVYRGVDRSAREVRAIKELNLARVGAPGTAPEALKKAEVALQRLFQNEMHLLHGLPDGEKHTGIVKLTEMWPPRRGAEAAYSMQLLGESLAQRLARGPLPSELLTDFALDLCEAVGRLHEQDIAHRNVSPSAIMFDDEDSLYLVGFDRACRLADKPALLAAEGAVQAASASPVDALGDPAYMSPEQCRSEDFDHRTDVYSIGCVVFHAAAGRPPFGGDDPLNVMLKHLSEAPPTLAEVDAKAPSGIQDFLNKALAKAPEDRFQDAVSAAAALRRFAKGAAPSASGATRLRIPT